jgi:uncharacterized repeat protein (TIGR01451 family)
MSNENFELNNYPNLIAIPYKKTLNEKDPQRKDHQRICLEMMLAFNASVCLANYYHYKTAEEGKDVKIGQALPDLPSDPKLHFDLGMMSIGKWNQITRDTASVLFDATSKGKDNDFLVADIGSMYRNKGSVWNKNVNNLISLRNQDAHGQIISDEALEGELKNRQKMVDQLMKEMSFYANYKLIVPIDDEVKEGVLVHICKDLSGSGDGVIELSDETIKTEIDRYGTYLYNTKKKTCLALNPMVVNYNSSPETEELDSYVYSKTANNKKDIHYSNFQGAIDLKESSQSSVGSLPTPQELCRKFSKFRVTVEDENLINRKEPKISIHRKFKSGSSIIDEEVFLDITIQNNGDADAQDLETVLDFPRKGFQLYQSVDDESITGGDTFQKKSHMIEIDELPAKKSKRFSYKFRARNFGGQYQFDEMAMTYSFLDENSDKMITPNLDEGVNVALADPVMHQVLDPNDPEGQVPIVNLKLSYSDHTPKIGDEIDFIVDVENIGKSIANNVDIHIFPPPEEMDLISGSTSWRGNINPSSKVTRKFKLRPRKQGIFNIKMRDILYTNSQGDLFKTLAYEDHKILVQNYTKNKYRFIMEDVWDDLVVEDAEQKQIDNQPDFKKFLEENKESAQKILSDVKIRAVKKVMNDILSRISLPVKQIIKKGMIGYCLGDYPFFIIDFTNAEQIDLLLLGEFDNDKSIQGIMKPLKGKKLSLMSDPITWKGKFTNFRFNSIGLSSLGEVGGSQLLKRLINQSVRYVENTGFYMSEFLNKLGQSLNYDDLFSRIYLTEKRIKGIVRDELQDMLKIQAIWLFKPQKYLNMVAERTQGMAQELFELGYKKTGRFNQNGKWEDSESKSTCVRLYHNERSDNSDQEMTDLLKKFLVDIAQASSMVAYKKNVKKENKEYFEHLLELMQETEKLESFHYRSEDRGIVFYKGDELPLYQPGTEYFCFEDKPRSTTLKFRYIDRDIFRKLGKIECELKDYWLYHVEYDESIKDTIDEIIRASIINSGNGKQQISHDWLLDCIKENIVQNLDKILQRTLDSEGDWVKYSEIDSNLTMKGLTTVWNKRNLKHFLEYDNNYLNEDGTKGRVKLIANQNLIKQVLDNLGK